MAVIKEYSAPNPIGVITPSPGGEEAFARAGRTGEEMARQVGSALGGGVARLGSSIVTAAHGWARQADISSVGTNLTNYNTQMMQEYRQQSATWNPADTEAPQKFMDQYQEGLQKVANNVYASDSLEYSHGLANHFYGHMNDVIAADASTRGGNHILLGLNSSMRAAMTAVGTDPSSAQNQIIGLESQLHAQISANPELSPRVRGELQSAFVKARGQIGEQAMHVRAMANPVGFLKEVNAGEWDNVVPRSLAVQFGEAQQRIVQSETRSQEYLNLALTRQHQESVASDILARSITMQPNGSMVINPAGFTEASKRAGELGPAFSTVVNTLQRAAKTMSLPPSPGDNTTYSHIYADILHGPLSTTSDTAIYGAASHGDLTPGQADFLVRMKDVVAKDPGLRSSYGLVGAWMKQNAPLIMPPGLQSMIGMTSMSSLHAAPINSRINELRDTVLHGATVAYQKGGLPAVQTFLQSMGQQLPSYALTTEQMNANAPIPAPSFGPTGMAAPAAGQPSISTKAAGAAQQLIDRAKRRRELIQQMQHQGGG